MVKCLERRPNIVNFMSEHSVLSAAIQYGGNLKLDIQRSHGDRRPAHHLMFVMVIFIIVTTTEVFRTHLI